MHSSNCHTMHCECHYCNCGNPRITEAVRRYLRLHRTRVVGCAWLVAAGVYGYGIGRLKTRPIK